MGTLHLRFRGVNAYVPHIDGGSLLVVMPNATRLGQSPTHGGDGIELARHIPYIWEGPVEVEATEIRTPTFFPGARLSFTLESEGSLGPVDLTEVQARFANSWLEVEAEHLEQEHNDHLGGQVLLEHGIVSVQQPAGNCGTQWSHTDHSLDLAPVVPGLDVRIDGVQRVVASYRSWLVEEELRYDEEALERTIGDEEEVVLYVGNLCAEDCVQWPRNGDADGRLNDVDFKWLFLLAPGAAGQVQQGTDLPVPQINHSAVQLDMSAKDALLAATGGGGLAGCECGGCGGKPSTFT